jgi:hypothetical protein
MYGQLCAVLLVGEELGLRTTLLLSVLSSGLPGTSDLGGMPDLAPLLEGDAPSGIRTRATTLKGWRPRPLVDGGGQARIAATVRCS